MAKVQFSGDGNTANVSKPVKRMRWATVRHTGQSGSRKRVSILNRVPKVHLSSHEEKGGGDGKEGDAHKAGHKQESEGATAQPRNIYFNLPLPPQELDENGHKRQKFVRNKIRTAKYTALSFVPKNLYFQFHNIANIYFFFIVILSVSLLRHLILFTFAWLIH
jgi:phospholipid-translocating ATPase